MKCFRMKTAAKMEGDTSVLITATNYMRFSGQIAGEKLQLSSQNICACFHAAAVPALFVYLFICAPSDDESFCHTARCSRTVLGRVWESAVCFSAHLQCWPHIPLPAPNVALGLPGSCWPCVCCAGLGWALLLCAVRWLGCTIGSL